jgi:hypothetical protein
MATLRDNILKLTGRRYLPKPGNIPGLGEFQARSMSELERAELEAAAGDRTKVKRLAVIYSICDAKTKQPLFTTADLDGLGQVDSTVIDKLAAAALSHSEISETDIKSLLGEPAAS